jgi:hypothetical protein
MGRKANAAERQTGASPHLDHDHRQRDRDAQPPIEHLVQITVSRVVVAGGVAAEALLAKQKRIQRGELAFGGGLTADALAQAVAQPIELVQVPPRVEVRVLLDRDEQRRARDVELALVPSDERAQRTSRFGRCRQLAQVPDAGLSPEPDDVLLPVGLPELEPVDPLEMVPPP